ncbi:HAD family hydrolase [Dyella japonica]|uniref:HAD family hydrolase n=1 Tax=Dyella japonica TaxID=231455 RepID=UPI00062D2DC1|nr:HAD family hydrolase [Dyella japonica]
MLTATSLVFLLDVDNTLLDNDGFAADLTARLDRDFGAMERERYWSIYNKLRDELGFADYLGALQQFRLGHEYHPGLVPLSNFLLEYPFAERLFPGALDAVAHMGTLGSTVILSDGDIVFQPRKIAHSGLGRAVQDRVLVYVHKERMTEAIQRAFPATHYVMVDDKPQLLAAMKRIFGAHITTIFVNQGHYAREAEHLVIDPAPDKTVMHISDLVGLASSDFPRVELAGQAHPDPATHAAASE